MPVLNFDCDVETGYDFKKESKATVGYLTQLQIGGHPLAVDQTTIADPTNPQARLAGGVVAVLSEASWSGEPTAPLHFQAYISASNARTIEASLARPADITVNLAFVVFQYDRATSQMFKALHSGDALIQGAVQKKGSTLAIDISPEPVPISQAVATFPISIGIIPVPAEQKVFLAQSPTLKLVLPWGEIASDNTKTMKA